jgi:hypothetical protein
VEFLAVDNRVQLKPVEEKTDILPAAFRNIQVEAEVPQSHADAGPELY